jgi:hypothetical protein
VVVFCICFLQTLAAGFRSIDAMDTDDSRAEAAKGAGYLQ